MSDRLIIGKWLESRYQARLPEKVYRWPMYVVGLPNTGKSTLLANLSLRLNALGEGVLVIDHKDGKLAKDIVQRADPDTLIYVSPGECYFDGKRHHWGLNPLEVHQRDDYGFATAYANTMQLFERTERAEFGTMQQMWLSFDSSIRLALYSPQPTLLDVRRILTEKDYRQTLLLNPNVPDELKEQWARFDDNKITTISARLQQINSSLPRLKTYLHDDRMRHMVTQPTSTIRLQEWLDAGKLVVCNFATRLNDIQADALADLMVAMFMNAAMHRPEGASPVWRLVADEFDELSGGNFATLVDKVRSRNVIPIMAHQNLAQLVDKGDDRLRKSITGAPVKLTLRVSPSDADPKAVNWVHEPEIREQLTTLPDHSAVLTLTAGLPGLLDRGQSQIILLDPLEEVDKDDMEKRLRNAIASQQAHTVAERRLSKRGTIEGNHGHQPKRTNTTGPRPLDEAGEPLPPGDDPTGAGGAELSEHLPGPDGLAGMQAPLPGSAQPRRSGANRRRRKASDQPGVPQTPEGSGTGGGETHRPAGQPPDQVGAQLPDAPGIQGPQGPPDGPRVGDAPLPPKRHADLPDD
jgi:hypothetical protein